jgi:hypothetical protein
LKRQAAFSKGLSFLIDPLRWFLLLQVAVEPVEF